MTTKWYNIREEVRAYGVAIIFICTTVGTYLNYFISASGWSELVTAIAIISICKLNNLVIGKNVVSNWILGIIGFELLCLFFGIAIGKTSLALKHNLPVIALIIAITSNIREDTVLYSKIIRATFCLSFICVLVSFYCVNNESIYDPRYMIFTESGSGAHIDTFTIALSALVNIIACLHLKLNTRSKIFNNYFPIFCILLDIYLTLSTGKRSPFIQSIALVIFWIIKNYNMGGEKLTQRIIFVVIFISITGALTTSDVGAKLELKLHRIQNGIEGIVTGEEKEYVGGSAEGRFHSRQRTWDKIYENFNFKTFLIGKGLYNNGQIDCQPLEIFADGGVCGLIFYLCMIGYPVVFFLKKHNDTILSFCAMNTFVQTIICYTSGTAYSFFRWFSLVIFFHILYLRQRENRRQKIYSNENSNITTSSSTLQN